MIWENYPRLSSVITIVLIKGRRRSARGEAATLLALKIEEVGQEPRDAGGFSRLEKVRREILS